MNLLQLLLPASLLFTAPSADAPAHAGKANKMERLDTNGNGTLSASEVAGTKLESRFSEIDTNRDGELTRDEMKAARKARKGEKDRDHRARGKKHGKRDKQARKAAKAQSKAFAKGEKNPRKAEKQALKKDETGGKKSFAKNAKHRKDRKRFAARSKNAT